MQNFSLFIRKRKKFCLSLLAMVLSIVVLMSLLSQTAMAQTTYVITDGDQVTVHTTHTLDPEKVLNEAGLTLNSNDFYTTQATQEGSEIIVQRAQNVTIHNCGSTMQVHSYQETVGQLLSKTGITLGADYVLSVPEDTKTYDGMEITIDHIVENEETYTEEIPYEVTYFYDDTMPQGREQVLVKGTSGQVLRKASVVYTNTQEQSRTVLEETVLEQPENQVVAVGTGKNVGQTRTKPLIGDGVIVLPSGEVLTYNKQSQFKATAYTIDPSAGVNETTATGTRVRPGVVAVDPKVIPYGTRMFIVANDGSYVYGVGTAEDCGGAIQGKKLDLYFDTFEECWQFGVRECTVYFLGDADWQ